jgi:hypothetical protein
MTPNDVIYPPCKYCGASHGMGIEEMATGKIEPMDICSKCLWNPENFKLNPTKEKIDFVKSEIDKLKNMYKDLGEK